MSYDLFVFDPAAAPATRDGAAVFAWIDAGVEDPASRGAAPPALLRNARDDVAAAFPGIETVDAYATHLDVHFAHGDAARSKPALLAIAARHGLGVADPQSEDVHWP